MGNILIPQPRVGNVNAFSSGVAGGQALISGLTNSPNALTAGQRAELEVAKNKLASDIYWKNQEHQEKKRVNDSLIRVRDRQSKKLPAEELFKTKEHIKKFGAAQSAADEAAMEAQDRAGKIAEMERAREEFGYEGAFGPAAAWVGSVPGLNKMLPGSEAGQRIKSYGTEMQLDYTSKTKGAISNKEMGLFSEATPGLKMTDAEASQVLRAKKLQDARIIERSKFFEAWDRANLPPQYAEATWNRFASENPVFGGTKGKVQFNEANVGGWERYIAEEQQTKSGVSEGPNLDGVDAQQALSWAQEAIAAGQDEDRIREDLERMYGSEVAGQL